MADGDRDPVTERFEESRAHLRAVASRMLGSLSEADDAVQEAWLRLSRSDAGAVDNLGGWLTMVVARVCLDMLRSRRARREEAIEGPAREVASGPSADEDLALADAIGPALLVVLDTLAPAERVAFVLHDMFDLSFDEIGPIVGRTPVAARQLASRARHRVRGEPVATSEPDLARRQAIVGAFLAASREGNFNELLALLDPDVVVRADAAAVAAGAGSFAGVRGARAVAEAFKGKARAAMPALVDGAPAAVWAPGGQTRAVFAFTLAGNKIVAIDLMMDAADLGRLDIELEE